MKKVLYSAVFLAVALSGQSATNLWYTDFSDQAANDTNADNKNFLPASPGLGEIATNVTHEGIYYRRNKSDVAYASMFSAAGAENNSGASLAPPADSVGGWALRAGYHGQSESYQNFTEVNTGVKLDTTNLIYTLTFRAKVQEDATGLATNAVGSGSITASWGWWDAILASNNFKWFASGQTYSNLTSEAWSTNSISFVGPRVNPDAGGVPLILRFSAKGPKNTFHYETWVDYISIDGEDRYADWVAAQGGLSSMDKTADDDLDGIDNFTEWATGGDPKDPGDKGIIGDGFIWDNNGTNVLTFVTPRQAQSFNNGVDYYFDTSDDLLFGSWTNIWPWEWQPVGDEGFNVDFDSQTNYFTVSETNDTQFIRLRADHRGYNP